MVEAFSQAMKGTKASEQRARNCIEKALIGQYCRSLGRDGTALFFQRCVARLAPQAAVCAERRTDPALPRAG